MVNRTKQHRRRGWPIRWIAGLFLLVFFGQLVAAGWQILDEAQLNPDARGNAAVVLGAAVYREIPSPVFRERINHAIDLYLGGRVEALIFTGGVGTRDRLAESEAARNYALAAGIPAGDIWIETVSGNTYENLEQAGILAAAQGFETLVIVSDPLHMRRAMEMAEEIGLNAVPSPTPTSRYMSWEPKFTFLLRETYFLTIFRLFPNSL